MRKLEIHAEDFGIVIAILSLVSLGLSSDLILRFISGVTVLFGGLLIGVGLSNPHMVIDLSLLRKRSHKE